ncbi:MAG: hypothetical protein JXA22_02610 [Candidatus Thermoplasmatota archaeon]|nr:hypothetical protein [Candidatus Thermoplasmatota archaeon]
MGDMPAPAFVCDEMLKKMARWLRIMGYDVVDPTIENDRELIDIARIHSRVLLTRDKDLSNNRAVLSLRIISDDLEVQIAELLDRYPPEMFTPGQTRCPACNGRLQGRSTDLKDRVWQPEDTIPEDVLTEHDIVYECEICRKIYWTGSHWDGIMDRLHRIGFTPKLPVGP